MLKTFDKKTGKKVFINLVCHELVKRPLDAMDKEVNDEQLDKFGIRNLRVPLDVGDPKPSTDKSGESATKCDVIFNPCVVEKASKPGPMQEYFIAELANLSIGWVAKEMQTIVSTPIAAAKSSLTPVPLSAHPIHLTSSQSLFHKNLSLSLYPLHSLPLSTSPPLSLTPCDPA